MFQNARSFVRVRAFTPQEAVICPEGSAVPRGTLARSNDGTITVLDPQQRFKPKRNGTFQVGKENTLWSFFEEGVVEQDGPVHSLDDCYDAIVKPVIPSIVAGYNAAFFVTGATDSGKYNLMYGGTPSVGGGAAATADGDQPLVSPSNRSSDFPSVNSPSSSFTNKAPAVAAASPAAASSVGSTVTPQPPANSAAAATQQGLFFHFAGDIFQAFAGEFRENAALSVEVEMVEIHNEQYFDLLNPQRSYATNGGPSQGTPSQSSSSSSALYRSSSTVAKPITPSSSFYPPNGVSARDDDTTIKVILDPIEGARLSGVTRATVSSSEQLQQVIRTALKQMKKRRTTHVIHLRFTETFQFSDPERNGQSISKARRINVLFAFLVAPPPSFLRCVDVAIERDSGEKPNAVVPYRDSAFTKLYADCFMQGYHLTFAQCVSPFVDHIKEATGALQFAIKVRKIKSNPKLNHDESLVELRRLADEVKGLKTEVIRQNESMGIVQQELDRREHEILDKELIYEEQVAALAECRKKRANAEMSTEVHIKRSQMSRRTWQNKVAEQEAALHEINATLRSTIEQRLQLESQVKESRKKAEELEDRRKEHEIVATPYKEIIDQRKERERELASLNDFIAREPLQRKQSIAAQFELKNSLERQIPQLEAQKKDVRADLGDSKMRLDRAKPQYDEVVAGEKTIADAAEMKKAVDKLKSELEAAEAENRAIQLEIDNAPSTKCCTAM